MRRSVLLTAIMAGIAASCFVASIRREALAHCEVPCGIYDEPARITAMHEDATTIAKAIDQINDLAGKTDAHSLNQATRWVNTKEQHATRIQHTISQYFLTQRVKPAEPGTDARDEYIAKLTSHHAVLVAAMKTKQGADPQAAVALHEAISAMAPYYAPQPKAEPAQQHDQHDHHQHDDGGRDHHH